LFKLNFVVMWGFGVFGVFEYCRVSKLIDGRFLI